MHRSVAGAVLLMLDPTVVAAQGFVSPAIGTNFGAAVGRFKFEPKVDIGVVTGWLGPGMVGFEVDINHTADLFTLRDPTEFGPQIARDSVPEQLADVVGGYTCFVKA